MDVYLAPLCAASVFTAHVLQKRGYKVLGFCDSTSFEDNTCYGIPIIKPEAAYQVSPEAPVVICSVVKGFQAAKMLITAGFANVIKLDLELLGNNKIEFILNTIDKINWNILFKILPKEKVSFYNLPYDITRLTKGKKQQWNHEIVLKSTEFVITEKCTLRCKHCANLFQYYENPVEHHVCKIIDLFLSMIDYVCFIVIMGGETFTYGDKLEQILLHIFEQRHKYGTLMIVTNGTIVPSEKLLSVMKYTCAFVRISDYDKLSNRKDELVERLTYWNIPFEVAKLPWYDIHKLNVDNGENTQNIFNTCDIKVNYATVLKSRWYYCEFLANAENLNAIPRDPRNSILLTNNNLTKKDLQDFIINTNAPPGCQYCSGSKGKRIKAGADQLSSPAQYKRYK